MSLDDVLLHQKVFINFIVVFKHTRSMLVEFPTDLELVNLFLGVCLDGDLIMFLAEIAAKHDQVVISWMCLIMFLRCEVMLLRWFHVK